MAKKYLVPINLSQNELQNFAIQKLASAPSSPVDAQMYFNTTSNTLQYYSANASAWVTVGTGTGSGNVTQSANSGSTGRMKVSAGSDKTIQDYTGGAGLIKSDANGVVTAATAGTDYDTATATATFQNKSITHGSNGNTIAGLTTSTFAANVIDTDGTLAANSTTRIASQSAVKTYVDNALQGLTWKQAVRAATTGNITLSAPQTIDGVSVVAGDRVLVKDQTTGSANGIYVVAAGAWTRATDADTASELTGAAVYVREGTVNADTAFSVVTESITLGTTSIVFTIINGGSTPVASTSVQGKVQLATQTEAEARTDSSKAVTPVGLTNFAKRYVANFGDGSATTITLTHNLGTKDVITQVREVSGDAVVECDIVNASTTTITLSFAVAPASNSLRAVILG